MQLYSAVGADVDERLPIGHDDNLIAEELVAQYAAQHLGTPSSFAVPAAAVHIELAQQRAKVACKRMHVAGRRLRKRLQNTLTPEKSAGTCDPASPGQVSDGNGDQGNDHAQDHEHSNKVPSRVGASSLDKTHVVNEDERPHLVRPLIDGVLDHVQRPLT